MTEMPIALRILLGIGIVIALIFRLIDDPSYTPDFALPDSRKPMIYLMGIGLLLSGIIYVRSLDPPLSAKIAAHTLLASGIGILLWCLIQSIATLIRG